MSTTVKIQNDSRHMKSTNEPLVEVGYSRFQVVNTHLPSTTSALHKLTVSCKHNHKRLVSGRMGFKKQMEIISCPTSWQDRQIDTRRTVLSTELTTWHTSCICLFVFYCLSPQPVRKLTRLGTLCTLLISVFPMLRRVLSTQWVVSKICWWTAEWG